MRSLVMSIVLVGLVMVGCRTPCKNNLPPANMLMHPGPGVDGHAPRAVGVAGREGCVPGEGPPGGPRQDPHSPYSGVISIFFGRAFAGAPLVIHGDGAQTRDMIFVTDVVDAIVRAAFSDGTGGAPVNVGTGRGVTVRELAELVVAFAKSNSPIHHGPPRTGDILHSHAAVARARDLLGFSAAISIAAGLERTAAWFAAQRAAVVV